MSFYLQPSNYLQTTFMKVARERYLHTFTPLYVRGEVVKVTGKHQPNPQSGQTATVGDGWAVVKGPKQWRQTTHQGLLWGRQRTALASVAMGGTPPCRQVRNLLKRPKITEGLWSWRSAHTFGQKSKKTH
jgi:hypothetical protein